MPTDLGPASQMVAQLGWVRRLAISLARDPEVAADLEQDVACEWLTRRPTWAERGAGLRAWLVRALRSRSVDRGRSERARRMRELAVPEPSAAEPADAVLDRLERQRRVAAAVQALPEPYRCAILHRYLDELPVRAVAQRTGVPEATARKRIERGLELLRTRLDSEFGSGARSWALMLLAPASRLHFEASTAGAIAMATVQGVWLMVSKKLVVSGLVFGAVAMGWWMLAQGGDPALVEVGGRGVVVPATVAAARPPALPTTAQVPAGPERTPVGRAAAAVAPSIRGFIFVDEQHRAPPDLAITVASASPGDEAAAAQIDTSTASWSLAPGSDEALTLWVTSKSTVPAQIPVPEDLRRTGGTFDLHLQSGRTLALLFLDAASKAPLAHLEFELHKAIELHRGGGRVTSRGSPERHRTDELGKVLVSGLPDAGYLAVKTDLRSRDRSLLLANGQTMRGGLSGEPIWSLHLSSAMPRHLEETIVTTLAVGEGSAIGQVPAWALAAVAGSTFDAVRVVARKWSDEPRGRGDPFVLSVDAQGRFELQAEAPSWYRVWLERPPGRDPLSAPALVVFTHAGAHEPIVFAPLGLATVRLRCRNVPAKGRLEVLVSGAEGQPRARTVACAGAPLTVEVEVAAGEQLSLALHAAGDRTGKSAWHRQLALADAQRDCEADLAGTYRSVEIASDVVPVRGEGAVALMACRHGEVGLDERIVVLCNDGRATSAVHVPAGRWLYTYDGGGVRGVWGVVDVPSGAEQHSVLSLQPQLHLVPARETQPALRFDEIDGVSLRALPERLRTWQLPAGDDAVALPMRAVWVRLPAPR